MNAPAERTPRSRDVGLPIAEAIGTRRLVIAIVTMPIIAVAAVVLIILYAQNRPDARGTDQPATTIDAPVPIRLGEGARVVETVSDGRRLIIRTESPTGGEIAVYDLATGRRLHAIPVIKASADVR